ncbi:MAG: hypothetical protein DDG59_05900 [Anaerolineae bacterium]|jgi:outer membrane protein assembly factor BamB|nr:MAG: hypothetical protein DDG59_05900 [Anaerolineae bacterium]
MDSLPSNFIGNFTQMFLYAKGRINKILQRSIFTFFLLVSASILTACSSAGMMSNWPGAIIQEGVIYVAYQAHVYAVRATNGEELWRFPKEADNKVSFYAPPALSPDGNQLIAGGFNHVLYSLDPKSGSEQWRFEESKYPYIASPLVTEDSIYAPTNDHLLYALDRKGNRRWEFKTSAPIWARPLYDPSCECIYIACLDHILYAVKAEDGSLLWQTERLEGAIANSPALSEDGILYFGTFGKLFHAFDPRSKTDLWTYTASNWIWGSPVLIEDQVLFTDLSGNIFALDAKSGAERWKVATQAAITAQPLVYNNVIYVGNEAGEVYALDLKGNFVWPQPKQFDGKILAAALTSEDLVVLPLVAKDHLMVALHLDGEQAWAYQPVK